MPLILILQSLTILLSPLYILRTRIIIPTTLLEIMIGVTFLVTLYQFWKDGHDFKKLRTKYDPLVAIFLIAVFIANLKSFNFLGGLGIFKAYFIEPILFYYCLIFSGRKYGAKFILNSFFITAFWLSLLGLLQKITHSYSLAPNEIAQGRVSAVFNSANSLALYLGPIIMLSLGMFFRKEKKKVLYFALFTFLTLIMIFTRSRGGIIAEVLSLSIFVYALLASSSKFLRKIWFVFPSLILVLIILFLSFEFQTYNFFPSTYGQPYTEGDTLQIRYFIWAGTVNMLKDNPIFGAGLDGFKTLYSNQYRLPQFQEEFQYPHNLILTFWTETGILGLFGFLMILVSSISLIMRNLDKKDLYLGAGLLAAFAYIVIHGIVDVPYFKNDLSLQFWVLIALTQLWFESSV